MPKKELDFYDATVPEEIEGIWQSALLYNSTITGTVFGKSEREVKKYIKRWVQQVPEYKKP